MIGQWVIMAPWALAALAVLPLFWWLLRALPPTPRTIVFPPFALLARLRNKDISAVRTPWWLVAFRLLLTIVLILAFAHPVRHGTPSIAGGGPLVLVIDNGWAAGKDWQNRQVALNAQIDRAARDDRPVVVVATAQQLRPPGAPSMVQPAQARQVVAALAPRPWAVDHRSARDQLARLTAKDRGEVIWLSDGLDHGQSESLIRAMTRLGTVMVMTPDRQAAPRVLVPQGNGLSFAIRSIQTQTTAAPPMIQALNAEGRVLAHAKAEASAIATFDLPRDLVNQIARVEITGEGHAGAVILADGSWKRRLVGLASSGPSVQEPPLIGHLFYVERALSPIAKLRHGDIAALVAQNPSMILRTRDRPMTGVVRARLNAWVQAGGLLLDFAEPNMGQTTNRTPPVALLDGERRLGGALSWTTPLGLSPFPKHSPFAGLAVPADVEISRQVLALPTAELDGQTWAKLSDGTPVVTAARDGVGWRVLFHVTANTQWSNLPLSGLFVQMLSRLTQVSQGAAPPPAAAALAPMAMLDGHGRLTPPGADVRALAPATTAPGPANPPGMYGSATTHRAFNLGPHLAPLRPLPALPDDVQRTGYDRQLETDLRAVLLILAALMFAIDGWIVVWLRGHGSFAGPGKPTVIATMAGLLILGVPQQARADTEFAVRATYETHLAYVISQDPTVDQTSYAGLSGLTLVLKERTSAELGPPMGINLETDELAFFPLLYWPVTPDQPRPSAAAADRINQFIATGGTIMFDTLGQGIADTGWLAQLGRDLAIPALQPVPDDHVLGRSFYLLDRFPGRWAGRTVWVADTAGAAGGAALDGVSSVIVGDHAWAEAWAMNAAHQPLFPVVPGGERQREMARRFGINLVIYALTGNYKADQVHLPEIIRRLGK